jgi:hypothetical protein
MGMRIFFHRYSAFEVSNFPIYSKGNAASAVLFLTALVLLFIDDVKYRTLSSWMIATSSAFFFGLTFVFTAPTIAHITFVRRVYLVLNHYVLCQFMQSIEWCTGTNKLGYMNHLTARKLLKYEYVTPEEIDHCTLAIVRNPYSRMVSIYLYNRFGPLESFPSFIKTWYKIMKPYRSTRETEEWHIPCHAIPMVEYTHDFEGKQLVHSVVKQEELKLLHFKEDKNSFQSEPQAADSSVSHLPEIARQALLGMPHENKRKTSKPWWEYYDQASLDLTYEMYEPDFEVFGYSPILSKRSDLRSPVPGKTI